MNNRTNQWMFRLMTIPGIILLLFFSYAPMVGIVVAFQNYIPTKGLFDQTWVGLKNFRYAFRLSGSVSAIQNTLIISTCKIVIGSFVPVVIALMLNEVRKRAFKRTVQTIVYLPHFLSWVVLGTMFNQIFSLNGVVNKLIEACGGSALNWLGDPQLFRIMLIATDVWKEFGWNTIVYLAAMTSIDPTLYEAAVVDGATKFQQIRHVTVPGIMPTVVLMATLSLGKILNAGFDQVFNLYNEMVYPTSDIIDTYVYRMGLVSMKYGLSSAVGLFKSVIGSILVISSNFLAVRYGNYRIF